MMTPDFSPVHRTFEEQRISKNSHKKMTPTATATKSLPIIPPAQAAQELERLTALLNETNARRAAREAELRELVSRSGGADALENLDAINGDMIRLSTALDLESRALTGARKRCLELAPVVADGIGQLSGKIDAQLRECLAIVKARAESVLGHYFDADQLPLAVSRTKAFRAELAFQQAHICTAFGLSYVLGQDGKDILAPDVQPAHLVSAYRRATELMTATSAHLAEVKSRRA
jgi:hypothetical protein